MFVWVIWLGVRLIIFMLLIVIVLFVIGSRLKMVLIKVDLLVLFGLMIIVILLCFVISDILCRIGRFGM